MASSRSRSRRAVERLSLPTVGFEGKFREADADGDGPLGFGEYLAAGGIWEPEVVFQDPPTMYDKLHQAGLLVLSSFDVGSSSSM